MKVLRIIRYLCIVNIIGILVVLFNYVSEIYPAQEDYPTHAHITLYIDRQFDVNETDEIMAAAMEWQAATNQRIEYDIIRLPTKEKLKIDNAIYFVKKSPDDPKILTLDLASQSKTLGLFDRHGLQSISIVSDRVDQDLYKSVVMHELGHSLGLQHIDGMENMHALMFPYTHMLLDDGTAIPAGSDHITPKDIAQFCSLYHCDPNNL